VATASWTVYAGTVESGQAVDFWSQSEPFTLLVKTIAVTNWGASDALFQVTSEYPAGATVILRITLAANALSTTSTWYAFSPGIGARLHNFGPSVISAFICGTRLPPGPTPPLAATLPG
jgi:hypothetical protein